MSEPLRYEITDWHQLSGIKSNTSAKLSIKVADIINNVELTGLRINVSHETYGPVFTCIIDPSGSAVITDDESSSMYLTTEQILKALYTYGFYVTYVQYKNLPSAQLAYLSELRSLGFDKLRILPVYRSKNGTYKVKSSIVVFQIKQNPAWINNTYICSEHEFIRALREGSCINISSTETANNWDWGWLDFVANIDDILEENANG